MDCSTAAVLALAAAAAVLPSAAGDATAVAVAAVERSAGEVAVRAVAVTAAPPAIADVPCPTLVAAGPDSSAFTGVNERSTAARHSHAPLEILFVMQCPAGVEPPGSTGRLHAA
ncbi:MAG: hypothetical protein IT368_16590 [Candidatus Hydrogenedentes bacterium]|nr:hypothetical protein [Candidatus Hydrogenedentota bacterium]